MVAVMLLLVMVVSGAIESEAASGSQVFLYGLHAEQFPNHGDHCSWMKDVENMYKMRDSAATVKKRHHSGAKNLYERMKTANYMMIVTHGSENRISAYSSKGSTSFLSIDYIMKGAELSQLKVCLLTACQAAKVARAIHESGAKSTIGFTKITYTKSDGKAQYYFNQYFTSGLTVSIAMHNACNSTIEDLGSDWGIKSYMIFGSTGQKF